MLPPAAIGPMQQALAVRRQSVRTGEAVDRPDPPASIADIKSLMSHEELKRPEERFLLPEHLVQTCGADGAKI